ncbi:RING-type domain-containing protein [Forsythia ovata]|uniref:RING-type domain-containing protein n=1 Tax=Forsythia ovata TaxID=205694 RepID=A0ABD1S0P6_9LAMI
MYFKGVSVVGPGDSGSRLSGIGVVMERSRSTPLIRVQKKLDFYVEELVADYLALLDGLSEAIQNNFRRVTAFTNSEVLYDQVSLGEGLEDPLVVALRQRILEQASLFFQLPLTNLWNKLLWKQIFSTQIRFIVHILIARFCLILMIACQPWQVRQVSPTTVAWSALFVRGLSVRIVGFLGILPLTCEEYQNLPLEERDASDLSLHRLAQNKRWRRCQQCRRMIELTHGCYHMTCWCRHEFCYSCGAEYREWPTDMSMRILG